MRPEENTSSPIIETLKKLLEPFPEGIDALIEPVLQASAGDIAALVDEFKAESDRHFGIDARISYQFANKIITLGYIRQDLRHTALGVMARGDALRMMGVRREAWNTLRTAGKLFRDARDPVGWARTRIGLLPLAADMNRMSFVEQARRRARSIFVRCDETEFAIRLDMNTVYLYQQRGLYDAALAMCEELIPLVEKSEWRDQHLIRMYTNMGYIYVERGEIDEALKHHHMAWDLADQLGEEVMLLRVRTNIAYIALIRGRYREALESLQEIVESAGDDHPPERLIARRLIVKCYLSLNRFEEAVDLALLITKDGREDDLNVAKGVERGYALIDLATAQANHRKLDSAYATLEEADAVFRHAEAQNWRFHGRLRRGQIALRRGEPQDVEMSLQDATEAASHFKQNGELVNLEAARFLQSQVAFKRGDLEEATRISASILQTAVSMYIPWLSYSSYLMLAQIAELQSRTDEALDHYESAAQTIESMQRGLTITLRPDFLQNREEALHGLIRLHFQRGDAAHAFEALERNKSQIFLSQIINRDEFRWPVKDASARRWREELETLRAQYHGYSELVYGQPAQDGNHTKAETQDVLQQRLKHLTRRMRELTEKLYLKAGGHQTLLVRQPSLAEVQARIEPDDLMIAYFVDTHHVWALVVEQKAVHSYRLPITPGVLHGLVGEVQHNVKVVSKLATLKGPTDPGMRPMAAIVQKNLRELYEGLLGPLVERLRGRRRLLIVPFGVMHYLPFHLLYNPSGYLIEQHEVVILPTAALLTLPAVKAPPGALVLADSWEGGLPATARETEVINQLIEGELHPDGMASLASLSAAPREVLHIAAHGKFSVDQPELSFIQLNGVQIYTDDLLQYDLGYELVTLSACETGLATVVPGDELVGLGRGFLYAGAGALITSLWRIDDQLTVLLMEHLYSQLKQGATKAAALRDAQLKLLREMPQLHPAFWGAFQLVGNADPLSSTTL